MIKIRKNDMEIEFDTIKELKEYENYKKPEKNKELAEYKKKEKEVFGKNQKVILRDDIVPELKKPRRMSKKEYRQKLKDVAEYMVRTNSKIGKASFTILGRYLSKAHKEKVKKYMKNNAQEKKDGKLTDKRLKRAEYIKKEYERMREKNKDLPYKEAYPLINAKWNVIKLSQ